MVSPMSAMFGPDSVDADGDLGKYEASPKPLSPNELRYVWITTNQHHFGPFATDIEARQWGKNNHIQGSAAYIYPAS